MRIEKETIKKLIKDTMLFSAMCATFAVYAKTGDEILKETNVQGGLIVHIDSNDGKLTTELHPNDRYIVQGFDSSKKDIEQSRKYIKSKNLYGRVSVEHRDSSSLPFIDNFVTLVVSESLGKVSMDEVMRVLEPNGIAYIKTGSDWKKTIKPRSEKLGDWTHGLNKPDGNIVSSDELVGPPKYVQWLAKPQWARTHRYRIPYTMITTNNRIFSIVNDVPAGLSVLPDRLQLVARNAFNGVLLWKIPILRIKPSKGPEDGRKRSNLPNLGTGLLYAPSSRAETRIVCTDNTVFAALGKNGEIVAIDAATGKHIKTYENTKETEKIIYINGVLIVQYGSKKGKKLYAINEKNGEQLWEISFSTSKPLSLKPIIKDKYMFIGKGKDIVCIDYKTGEKIWIKNFPNRSISSILLFGENYSGPMGADRLIAYEDVLVYSYLKLTSKVIEKVVEKPAEEVAVENSDKKEKKRRKKRGKKKKSKSGKPIPTTMVISAKTGEVLWEFAGKGLERAGTSVFLMNGLLWTYDQKENIVGLDIHTGKNVKTTSMAPTRNGHHHRCYADKATKKYVITGMRGMEFIDIETGDININPWLRGSCYIGVLPANGLMYKSQDGCGCYLDVKLNGHAAIASDGLRTSQPVPIDDSARLTKGSAYSKETKKSNSNSEWRTHRQDSRRSASTNDNVSPTDLKSIWDIKIGGKLSGLTAADGKVFVSSKDENQVCAIDAKTGKKIWSFTTFCGVDSPPTIDNGLAIFGSRDGFVYCLNAETGELKWRFQAAPVDRRILDDGLIESAWPVHGCVLVDNGIAYFSAGRTSLLDGGIYLYGVDVKTGKLIHKGLINDVSTAQKAADKNDGTEHIEKAIGVLQDILVKDGDAMFMQFQKIGMDLKLGSKGGGKQLGFLGDSLLYPAWFCRTGWYIGEPSQKSTFEAREGKKKANTVINEPFRQGQYLIFDDKTTYGMRIFKYIAKLGSFVPGADGYELFADSNESDKHLWSVRVPVRIEAMIVTDAQKDQQGKILFIAGTPDIVDTTDYWAAVDGRKGGKLWSIDATNGKAISKYDLKSAPVFDGMIAENGKIYIATKDGSIVCWGNK